jgi:hypothetical protein
MNIQLAKKIWKAITALVVLNVIYISYLIVSDGSGNQIVTTTIINAILVAVSLYFKNYTKVN